MSPLVRSSAAALLLGCTPSSPAPVPVPGVAPPPAPMAPIAPAVSAGTPSRVQIEVDPTKADGRAWDAGDAPPDIAFCVRGPGVSTCRPEGSRFTEVHEPQCRDSFACVLPDLPLPAGPLQVTVLDVDALANDMIGEGACALGSTCRLGQAVVRIVDAREPAVVLTTAAAPAGTAGAPTAGTPPPAAIAAIARIRQLIGARDWLALRGMMLDDGEFMVARETHASSAQTAVEAWRRDPTMLLELDRLLTERCGAELDDDMVIVTCPASALVDDSDYSGPIASLAEPDEGRWQLVGFAGE